MKMFILCCLALLVTVHAQSNARFVNNYDEGALMTCPYQQYMFRITSVHSNPHEDRKWGFECRRGGYIRSCAWSGYVNDFDRLLTYICPDNKVITGITSYHDNRHEDRRFAFQCCDFAGKRTSSCVFTPYVNEWDKAMYINARQGYAIKGATSHHDNRKEDRRWRFLLCRLY